MSSIGRFLINGFFVFSVVFIWLMLLYQFILTLGGFLWRQRLRSRTGERAASADLPGVSILIPAKNEEKVIAALLERIGEFDYPAEKVEVIVINDGSTDRTAEIIRDISRRDPRIGILDIPPEEGGKGKSVALNRALEMTRHEVVAVYDADNIPERDSLRLLCQALIADRKLAAVVGKFRAYNRAKNWLTRLINIEGIAFQWIIQAGRWYFMKLSFIPGTNFVIWKSVVKEVGGWDPEALTEDSELTFRIYEKGYVIQFLPTATTWEQEPEKLSTWVRQRTRWARGNNYIIAKYGRKLFTSRPRLTSFELINLLYLYYFFIFAILISDILFVFSLFGMVHISVIGPYAELWGLAFLLYILEIMIALSFEREDRPGQIFYILLAYITYTKLWVFVVLRGIYLETFGKGGHVWVKTERFDVGSPGQGK